MNYFEWAQEYYNSAKKLEDAMLRFKAERVNASISRKDELDKLIAQYRIFKNDCLDIANQLMLRHRGEG